MPAGTLKSETLSRSALIKFNQRSNIMKEYVMVYRSEPMGEIKLTPEGNLDVSKEWENWMGGIAAQNRLVSPGMRLGNEGRVVKPGNVVTNGPYAEIKEIIGGVSVFKADSIE